MGDQRTFASMAWSAKGKVTRRERFLAEMDAVIPWPRLIRCSAIGNQVPNPAAAAPSVLSSPGVISAAASTFASGTKLPRPSATSMLQGYVASILAILRFVTDFHHGLIDLAHLR